MLKPIFLKSTLLLTTVVFGAQEASAFSGRAPAPEPTPEPTPAPEPGAGQRDKIVEFGVNLAILYGRSDARYSRILTALNIYSADDLFEFLDGSRDGRNFGKIIARLAFTASLYNDDIADSLARMGITNELELREFLASAQDGVDLDFILRIALSQADIDPKYTRWLEVAGIDSIDDLRALLSGDDRGTNMQSLILFVGLHIVKNDPKLQEYAIYIEAALMTLDLTQGMDGSGSSGGSKDDIINLGAFDGMTVGETEEIQYLN